MAASIETRIEEYWEWIAWALFLLLTLDLLTTLYAAHAVGVGGEANPLIRWLIRRGGVALAAVNVVAGGLVGVLFYGLMELLRVTPSNLQYAFARLIELWLGLLLAAGLAVFANNLVVIVAGISLF